MYFFDLFFYELVTNYTSSLSQWDHEAGSERHHGSDRKWQVIVSVFVKLEEAMETLLLPRVNVDNVERRKCLFSEVL